EVRERAAPLGVVESGHTYYDLASEGFAGFGKAVGDARLVVLGGENVELRSQLTKYLVAHKGFVIVDSQEHDEDLVRWVRAFNKNRRASVKFAKSTAEKTVMWTDYDTASRARGAGTFAVGFLARDEVLRAAQIPLFFLDLRSLGDSALGKWVNAAHAFD